MKDKRKVFVLDTSVLLYDKISIHSFPGNDVVIPLVVLDELDRFKESKGLLGENARYINRFLDDLRAVGRLHEGVAIENDQTIRVEINHNENVPTGLDPDDADNKIIAVANELSNNLDKKVIVVTKDINFRVKCDALDIDAEDYNKDRIVSDEDQIYTGFRNILTTDEIVDLFYANKSIHLKDIDSNLELCPNQYVVCKGASQSFLGVVKEDKIVELSCVLSPGVIVNSRNKEQKFALDMLTRDDIPLVTMTGIAGSGKTFLTIVAALAGLGTRKYDRIVITRSLQTVGKDIGFLPGDIKEKMDPWIQPIVDNARIIFGNDSSYFYEMERKGQIEIAPLPFIRGRTFNKTFLIVDESQNSSIHELKTIITRIGENSKIVLLGDVEQIDTPYIDTLSSGLTIVIEKFKNESEAGHIKLIKGERSRIATLATKIL